MPLSDFLRQTCDILAERPGSLAANKDSVGGTLRTPWVTLHEDVPCMVRELDGSDEPEFDSETNVKRHEVKLAADYALTPAHVLLVEGRYLHVVSSRDFNSLGRFVSVVCEEVVAG